MGHLKAMTALKNQQFCEDGVTKSSWHIQLPIGHRVVKRKVRAFRKHSEAITC